MRGTIGIIGGRGRFGSWFREFFDHYPLFSEQTTLLSDLSTELSPLQLTEQSDVVLVSVPISVVREVIDEIKPALRGEKLLIEITSVKTHLTEFLSDLEVDVLSLHPMFAPSLQLTGQRVTHFQFRNSQSETSLKHAASILAALEGAGALLIPITPDEHDRAMAIIQGLTHLSAIATARALEKLGADIPSLALLASPVYRIRMATAGRILAQDPRLYGEIATVNPYIKESVYALQGALAELSTILELRDVQGFSKLFTEAATHLGEFLREAQEESDFLISALAERKK